MLDVGIDLERLRSLNSGLGQFCLHLSTHLLQQKHPGMRLHYYYPQAYAEGFDTVSRPVGFFDKLLGVNNKALQLFHCTHQDSHLFPKRTPTILTIHDLNFLEKYKNPGKRQIKLRALQQKIDRAKGLTFISNFTEQLVRQHLNIPKIPARVIYNGNCLNASVTPVKPAKIPTGEFIFSIGIINPKKNFHVLLPLVKETGLPLVIAGNKSNAYAGEIIDQAHNMGIADKVILTGPVSDAEKLWLYRHCKAFVFPSLSEGFGLPVIEAMSVGKPVFLSNKTSLPEVGGALAFYWSSFDPAQMLTVFNEGLTAFEQDTSRQSASIAWAGQFSWERTAQQYLEFYSEVYNAL